MEMNRFEEALKVFMKQSEVNELAENQYYSALSYKALKKPRDYKACLEKAKELYIRRIKMFDTYTNPMDTVFLKDIENEFREANYNSYK